MSSVTIVIDGVPHPVPADVTLAAAMLNIGVAAFRRDFCGGARGPVCGIGTCFECRVTIDGVRDVRACLTAVRDGMSVESAT